MPEETFVFSRGKVTLHVVTSRERAEMLANNYYNTERYRGMHVITKAHGKQSIVDFLFGKLELAMS